MVESCWGRMQVELINRQRWKTRIELASAIHGYIELWHNTRRRHSSLGMLTPSEIEAARATAQNGDVVHAGLARTAPTAVVDERSAAGLAGTYEGMASLDHQNLLLNDTTPADSSNSTPLKPGQIRVSAKPGWAHSVSPSTPRHSVDTTPTPQTPRQFSE
jgi:hypothetical protein